MCTCAIHCTRSAYHEKACCNEPLCGCGCHGPRCSSCGSTEPSKRQIIMRLQPVVEHYYERLCDDSFHDEVRR